MIEFNSRRAIEQRHASIRQYLDRRQLYPFQIETEPSDDLGLLVVIPCFDESDLNRTLESLARCDAPDRDVEIIVVINGPEGMNETARENNLAVLRQTTEWGSVSAARLPDWLRVFGLWYEDLPIRHAGVGMARKLGMDEAVGRIGQTQKADGLIVCLDADCEVEANYLSQIDKEFSMHRDCPGVSIYFEHPPPRGESSALTEAIVDYELHLRCYIAGQRFARFPYAFHTVGSAMACRGASYAEQGGMNRRKAGEDFYFIQKLVALGGYRALNSATVYPAARLSDRVPFGTGPAMKSSLNAAEGLRTFSPDIFQELRTFCALVFDEPPSQLAKQVKDLPAALAEFLQNQNFSERLIEIEDNVSDPANFRKRIFRWFNAFRFLKFAQFASREHHAKMPVGIAATQIANIAGIPGWQDCVNNTELLSTFRRWDRHTG